MGVIRKGLTYADVLLIPKKSVLNSRSEADLRTKITKNVSINLPLVSSNMASVTESKMAIAMAREGGIGIIHQFNKIEEQIEEIKKVKKSTSYIIENPVDVPSNYSIKKAVAIMKKKGVTSLVVQESNNLVGIFTKRDYIFERDLEKQVKYVMTPKNRMVVAPFGISLDEAKEVLHKNRIEKLPLIDEFGKLKGLMTTQDIKKLEYWPNATRDSKGRLKVGGAVGVKDTLERTDALIKAGVDLIVLDVAHGHSERVIRSLRDLKNNFDVDVLVGNIATENAARDLIEAGADGLKVGIGPSPVCTTRIISGAGVPQFTAVQDVFKIAKEYKIPVCADGGCKYPGDFVKALAVGANTVMSGSVFAGTDESPGRVIMKDGKRYKRYIGSASYDSNHERTEKANGKKITEKIDVFVEGVSNLVDYKGPVEEVVKGIIKGIRSGVSYCGARNLEEMKMNAEFIEITNSGLIESGSRGNKISE